VAIRSCRKKAATVAEQGVVVRIDKPWYAGSSGVRASKRSCMRSDLHAHRRRIDSQLAQQLVVAEARRGQWERPPPPHSSSHPEAR